MRKCIAFIPARGGSKSIPRKNIKAFCGKPLIYWVCKAACESLLIDEVILATEDLEIKQISLSFDFPKLKVFDRSKENASDSASTESVMLEYLNSININRDTWFVLIQATSPFVVSRDISLAIENIWSNDYDSLLSTARFKRFLWGKDARPINYDFTKRPRRQEFEGILIENGAFYISKVGNVLDSGNRVSGNIGLYEMPEYSMMEIDEPDDWVYAEYLMQKHILLIRGKAKKKIKLVLSDVDGVLTDAGMYYSEGGDELKKFNTHDGMGFQLLREAGIRTGIITSEVNTIVERRAKKLKVDYLYQARKNEGKLSAAQDICDTMEITLEEVAYIGDDINCYELLNEVGIAACPNNASDRVKSIPKIHILDKNGGAGVFREFVDCLILG